MLRWGSLALFLQSGSLMMTLIIVFMIKIVTMTNFVFIVIIQAVSQSNLNYLWDSHVNLENVFKKKNYECNNDANNRRNVTINIIYKIICMKMSWVPNNMNNYCVQNNNTNINKIEILTYSDCCNNNMKLTVKNKICMILVIIIMVIFKCYFSGELIALSHKKKQQQWCEHRIMKNKQIKSTVHDANKKNEINKLCVNKQRQTMKIQSICRNQWQKKEALYKQAALVKAASSIK